MDNNDEKEEIEIVSGNGDLEISPVFTHININKKSDDDTKKKNIVIPEEKK